MQRQYNVLYLLIIIMSIHFSADCQRKHSKQHNGWKDTTGTADMEQSRKQFWDNLPDPTGLTTDFENIFTPLQKYRLDSLITAFERRTSIEFCIVTMDTMKINKERFGDLPNYIQKSWGIGKKETDNGIVICLSVGFHAIRIGTGKGLENYFDDRDKLDVIQHSILPEFKKEKYFEGTYNGLVAIIETLDKRMKGKSSALR